MRLFLYLLALVVGFSPAQASRAVLLEPVSVGAVSQPATQRAAQQSLAAPAHAHLRQILTVADMLRPIRAPLRALTQLGIVLTDRPRA